MGAGRSLSAPAGLVEHLRCIKSARESSRNLPGKCRPIARRTRGSCNSLGRHTPAMNHETWRAVEGYEGIYEVSDLGNVRSLDRLIEYSDGRVRNQPGVVLKQATNSTSKYKSVTLWKDNQDVHVLVHRLVLTTFVGPCPEGMECCHNNGVHGDNRLQNLRWDTHSENQKDLVRSGKHVHARKTHCPAGHSYDETNTALNRGARQCRECKRAYGRKQYRSHTPEQRERHRQSARESMARMREKRKAAA